MAERPDLAEAVALGCKLEEIEQAEAKKRQAEGQKAGGHIRHGSTGESFPQADKGRVRDRVGAAVGMSGRTWEKARSLARRLGYADETAITKDILRRHSDFFIEGQDFMVRKLRTIKGDRSTTILSERVRILWSSV